MGLFSSSCLFGTWHSITTDPRKHSYLFSQHLSLVMLKCYISSFCFLDPLTYFAFSAGFLNLIRIFSFQKSGKIICFLNHSNILCTQGLRVFRKMIHTTCQEAERCTDISVFTKSVCIIRSYMKKIYNIKCLHEKFVYYI